MIQDKRLEIIFMLLVTRFLMKQMVGLINSFDGRH